MVSTTNMIQVNLLADLKVQRVAVGAKCLVMGKTTVGDGLGGFYYWDAASALAEDLVYLNVIISSITATGRWIRIFQRVSALPHGVLERNGGIKRFYATGTTNSSGEITLNLTMDNTPTGTAIFSEIWLNNSKATTVAATPANAVSSYVMALASDLKTTKHGFYKANVVTLVLGLLLTPVATVGAGTVVQFEITGV